MARTNEEVAIWTVSLLDPGPRDRLLEVGFGPGLGIDRAARMTPDGFVAGIDSSPQMVAQARERNRALIDVDRVELRRGVAEDLPYDDDAFDAAFTINSIQLWRDPVTGLRELRRVVRPGGTIAIALTRHAGTSAASVRRWLDDAGLDDDDVKRSEAGTCVLVTVPA
ncbi:class I SAM-dependent methyltransferase [Haloferacaceae archaeon DSL9]